MNSALIRRFGCSKLALKLSAACLLGIEQLETESYDFILGQQILVLDSWFKTMPAEIAAIFAWEILLSDS